MVGLAATVGRYHIRSRLGQGGFATVYRAYDPTLDREVALKVLHPHLAAQPNVRRRFLREGQVLARVDHPNVVAVYDAGEADGFTYLAMKLVPGQTLEEYLTTRGPLPLHEVVALIYQTAMALAAVHRQRLVHRDVKPANILLDTESGQAVLLDLGIAHTTDATTMTGGGWIMGTLSYMAPEQVTPGGQVTAQTDVYQLGATAYTLLAGRPPFAAEGEPLAALAAIRQEIPPDLGLLRPDLPRGVVWAVQQAMAKRPEDRPAGPLALASHLRTEAERPAAGVLAPARPPAEAHISHHPAPRPSGAAAPAAPTAPAKTPRLPMKASLILVMLGMTLLFVDIAVIIGVVLAFNLNEAEPSWEQAFTVAVLIVVPACVALCFLAALVKGFFDVRAMGKRLR